MFNHQRDNALLLVYKINIGSKNNEKVTFDQIDPSTTRQLLYFVELGKNEIGREISKVFEVAF